MFYSQFILAKKGPLGTIWIAAHLERKLRKNQVADTDIGVSVDSILSPDVPIALRLSSHLLLGVVRIYSKKVNYLFDDCSEALLKIKQAFRSTAVDLPPEESTAPYHSITLPETFDLDDFELPDDDIYQNNYVDRHISSKDQITLQDTMDGVAYTSQFGLDERFGDGDTSGLDLDEELFMSKVAAAENNDLMLNAGSDPQSSFQPLESSKHDDNNEPTDNSDIVLATASKQIEENDDGTNFIEYDQAPRTPGLLEEPNWSNIQETSACDDHLESEHQNLTEIATKENLGNGSSLSDMYLTNKNDVNGSLHSGLEAILDISVSTKDKTLPKILESDQEKLQGELVPTESIGLVSDLPSIVSPAVGDQIGATSMKVNSSDKTCAARDGAEDLQNGIVSNNETFHLNKVCQPVSRGLLENDEAPHKMEFSDNVEIAAELVQSCLPIGALKPNVDSNGTSDHQKSETQKTEKSKDTLELDNCVTENMARIAPNSSHDLPSGVAGSCSLEASGRAEDPLSHKSSTEAQGEYHENNASKQLEEGNDVASLVSCNKSTDQAENAVVADSQLETITRSVSSDLPAPEKLLSVPEVDAHNNLSVVATPGQMFAQTDVGYDTSITVLGKKRSFTESALTMQSQDSVKSTATIRTKATPQSVPGDDDLLSSILVGRKSSALQIKETPQQNIPYLKRHKPMPRASASKRKVLMDDMMVLHGDMIRQQLTDTEDIRRLRKKAPCTRPEIFMIQKQFLEDDIFSETIFTGVSMELASLHNQTYDLSETRIALYDVPIDNASSEFGMGPSTSSLNDRTGTSFEAANDMDLCVVPDSREARIEGSSDIVEGRVSDEAHPVETPVLTEIQIQQSDERAAVSSDPTFDVVDTKDSQDFCGEAVKMDVDVVKPNATVVDHSTSSVNTTINDDADRTAGVLVDANVNIDPDASLQIKGAVETADKQLDVLSFEMDTNAYGDKMDNDVNAVIHDAKMTEEDLLREVETCASVQVETEIQTEGLTQTENVYPPNVSSLDTGGRSTQIITNDPIMGEARQNDEAVFDQDTFSYAEANCNAENLMSGGIYDKEDIMNFFSPAMGEDGNTREAGSLTIDQLDYDNLDYAAAGNNTEFLNYDDDEVAEADDEDVPNTEEARFIENSGWSTRTRAVAKYLQTLFEKEAEQKRNVLPIDNLLAGKSRKEASRMFFETLVLKTKDYIHVEQTSPFDNINILPRAKLTKIDF